MLPIQSVVKSLCDALKHQDVILKAPPGAGKSTYLPLTLLELTQFQHQRIILLQPRRVAVKTIAYYLASQLGETPGQQVGYRIKGESKVGNNTRLEVVTEGVLIRMLQSDPELTGVGLVIFDEFHERSLAADFSLALCCDVRQGLRDDLRILVMSATLDGIDLPALLPDAQLIESEGRQYPIDVHYQGITEAASMVFSIRNLLIQLTQQHEGNILVFLPSKRLITQLAGELTVLPREWQVCPLYGDLPLAQQQQAIEAPKTGYKVVLSTNIAETSLTIDGITCVIDSGLVNQARFKLRTGHNQLSMQQISQASSTQRSGRAGRLAPGVCYRMWSRETHERRQVQTPPAILREDITDTLLQSLVWGCELKDLSLLDQPTSAQLSYAYDQLKAYSAVDNQLKLTPRGRQLAAMGTQLPMASMLLYAKGQSSEILSAACTLVGLIEARDKHNGFDFLETLGQVQRRKSGHVWQLVKEWHRKLDVQWKHCDDPHDIASLLLYAYPNRVAFQLGKGRYQLASGGIVNLDKEQPSTEQWLIAIDLFSHAKHQTDTLTVACPIPPTLLETHASANFIQQTVCEWQDATIRVVKQWCYGRIVYQKQALGFDSASDEQKLTLWKQYIADKGFTHFNWNADCDSLLMRLSLLSQHQGDDSSLVRSKEELISSWETWLAPHLLTISKLSQLGQLNLCELIKQQLPWASRKQLDELFPQTFIAPTGTKAPIRYEQGQAIVSVRIQEVFGLSEHPRIANNRLPLTFELLSPARRPIQVTADLPAFWRGSYQAVKRDMKSQYIKHYWPDDPSTAAPTTRTKNKM